MQARIDLNRVYFYSRSRSIAQPVVRKGHRVQQARHTSQTGEMLRSGVARSPLIRNALFVTIPEIPSTSKSDNSFGTSADQDHKTSTLALPSDNSKKLLWNASEGIIRMPEWFDDLHHRNNSSPLGLGTQNAVVARLRHNKEKLPPRVLLHMVNVAIRAENAAAVRVYLKMLDEASKGQSLTKMMWQQFGPGLIKSLDKILSGHPESWRGSQAKQIWAGIITGLDAGKELDRARLRKPSLFTLFPKGSPRAWEGYLNSVGTLRDADLLCGEWARFAQAELSNCAIAAKSAMGNDGAQIRLSTSSTMEPCAMATKPSSETCSADPYTELERDDIILHSIGLKGKDSPIERQQRNNLANKIMCSTFNRLISPLGAYDRAWQIAHESDPIFGAIDAKNWARLLVETHSFQNWTPKTNIPMMEFLKDVEQKSRDRPAPPELVAAIELLEADLGTRWMGAIDGHRMLDERFVGNSPGLEEQSDESLIERRDEEQSQDIVEKQRTADDFTRRHVRIRAAKKRKLATDLNRIDSLLRAFPSQDHRNLRQQHGSMPKETARVPLT